MSETLTNLLYHIVFSTKMRMNMITPELAKELYPYIGGIIRGEKGKLLKIGGTSDHVHLLAVFHPSKSVSEMVKRIKGNSSRWINESRLIPHKFEWQRGYGAFSVSESACYAVAKYIGNQDEHHKKMTFQDEYMILLKKNRIQYDGKQILD